MTTEPLTTDKQVTILPSTTITGSEDDMTSLEATPDGTDGSTTTATEVTLTPPMAVSTNQSTTTPAPTGTMKSGPKSGQHIPIEVPLQLQLIVAPEADRIAILPPALASTNREPVYDQEAANRRRPSWRSPSLSHYREDRPWEEEQADCSPKSSLVAVSVVAVVLQVITLVAFYFFYRMKRSSWTEWSNNSTQTNNKEPVYGIRHSGSVSEVVSSPSQFEMW